MLAKTSKAIAALEADETDPCLTRPSSSADPSISIAATRVRKGTEHHDSLLILQCRFPGFVLNQDPLLLVFILLLVVINLHSLSNRDRECWVLINANVAVTHEE